MYHSLVTSLLLFIFTSYSDSSHSLRIVPVDQSPDADNVQLTIQYPEDNELKNSLPIHVQVRVDGFPLGIETELPRRKEIRACDKGQTIRVVVDDNPYILLNEDDAPSDAFDNHDVYFRQSVETHIKQNIKPGDHLIRVYPAYSYGEAVRGDGSYNASTFCYKKQGITKIDLSAPMITYNEPTGSFKSNQPILLDFLVNNCELSSGGYTVKLSIDGKAVKTLTSSMPNYIYGLSKGSHIIKLELLDRTGKLVNNPFTSPSRTITVH
jgi:hypothetical protein